MATTLRDWHVALVDEDGDPINSGNPLAISGVITSVSGTFQSTTVVGQAYVGGSILDIKRTAVNMTTAAAQDIVAAVGGKRIRVVAWYAWPSANCELEWLSASTVLVEALHLSPRVRHGDKFYPGFWVQTAVGEALRWRQPLVESPVAATIRGVLEYLEVS